MCEGGPASSQPAVTFKSSAQGSSQNRSSMMSRQTCCSQEPLAVAWRAPSFLSPCPQNPARKPFSSSSLVNRRPMPLVTPKRRVARRQRLHATTTPPRPPNSESGEPPEGEKEASQEDSMEGTSEEPSAEAAEADEDAGMSDLVLPNLRELFEGAGRPGCEQCDGKGEIDCPVCDSKGFVSLSMMDTVSSAMCRLCRGSTRIPCPTCREMVYKSVLWWDQIPSKEDDPDEKWRDGPDGPRISWSDPPAGP